MREADMLNLSWAKCGDDGHWCNFERLNLDKITDAGVYIIWHGGNPSCVVRLGQGNIADRLLDHRLDEEVMAYKKYGLYVTWASVPSYQRDGVEAYLAEKWDPLVGDRFPDVSPIAVNSPWV
jgi:hypothetical protein